MMLLLLLLLMRLNRGGASLDESIYNLFLGMGVQMLLQTDALAQVQGTHGAGDGPDGHSRTAELHRFLRVVASFSPSFFFSSLTTRRV